MEKFQNVFATASENITEPIIDAVAKMMDRVIDILKDPRLTGAMRNLASTIATQATRFFDAFTTRVPSTPSSDSSVTLRRTSAR